MREKIFIFRCEQNRKYVKVQAINFLTACKYLYEDVKDFSFILIAIL